MKNQAAAITARSVNAWTRATRRVFSPLLALASAMFFLTALLPAAAMAQTGIMCSATGDETGSANDLHFYIGETVQISGSGFAPACDLKVAIDRPDGTVDATTITTDAGGNFSFAYPGSSPSGDYFAHLIGLNDAELMGMYFTAGPFLSLDKGDYRNGETVRVTGLSFTPLSDIVIQVTRPDGSIVRSDGTVGSDTVTTDQLGDVAYDYVIRDGVMDRYNVDALDQNGAVLASTFFTDSALFTGNFGTASNGAGFATSLTITNNGTTSGVPAGSSIIVAFSTGSSNSSGAVSCADSVGNIYNVDVAVPVATNSRSLTICSSHGVTALSSAGTITVNFPNNGNTQQATANVFSGLTPTGTLDKTKTAAGTSNAPSTGNTATTSQADELLIGAFAWNSTNETQLTLPGAGYTLTNANIGGPSATRLGSEYRFVTSTGAYAADGTLSSAVGWLAAIATYKIAATKLDQTITLSNVPASAAYNSTFTPTATSTSGLPVTITVAGVCTINGSNLVTMTSGTGNCTVKGNQAGDGNYNAAPEVTADAAATKLNQTITLGNVPASAAYNATFTPTANSTSGLPVTITVAGVCTINGSNLVTMTSGTGNCTVKGNQAGDGNYNAAPEASAVAAAGKLNQTITLSNVPASAAYNATFTPTATSTSGLPVTITVAGVCSIGGSDLVTMTSGTGNCTVKSNQAGDANYNAAPEATAVAAATKLSQTITGFASTPASPITFSPGGTFTVSATGGASGIPVIFASTTLAVCTVSGSTVTMVAAGSCVLTANQAGNSDYSAAPQVSITVVIGTRTILVNYIGQLTFVTSGSSATTAQVTLSASLQDPTGVSLSGAKVDFIDSNTGTVMAKNVTVSPVSGSPGVGTANTIVTLSTGQFGSQSYLILVVATGNYTNAAQATVNKTAVVVVAKPAATNEITGGGTIVPASRAGTYSGTGTMTFSGGVKYNKSGTNLQGQIILSVPQSDGSIVVIKSNSLSSLAVASGSPKSATLYSKATMYRNVNGTLTTLDGNVTLRMDAVDNGATGDKVGFTVLSTKDSTLYFSNNWILDGSTTPATWRTVPQAVATGGVWIN